jgi:hypothetical protein
VSVANIKTRWVRRAVLVIVMVPATILGAILGAVEGASGLMDDVKQVWKL